MTSGFRPWLRGQGLAANERGVMAEVPAHLEPRGGLSDARIRFAGFDSKDHATIVSFEISQGNRVVGSFTFELGSTNESIDHIALAHQKMNDALRQMLH